MPVFPRTRRARLGLALGLTVSASLLATVGAPASFPVFRLSPLAGLVPPFEARPPGLVLPMPAPATGSERGTPPERPAPGAADFLWLGDVSERPERVPRLPPPPRPPGQPTIVDPAPPPAIRALPQQVRRRDPLEPPLLPEGEWTEWLARVVLNGEVMSEGALVLQSEDGRFAARVLDLRDWRVRLDDDRIITFNGEPYYPLDALPELEQVFDGSTLTLELVLPPEAFEASTLEGGRSTYLEPDAARGGFFDYDLLFTAGGGVRERLDALLEVGAFDDIGTLLSNFRVGDVLGDGRDFVRLETTYIRDLPEQRATFRVGDSLTGGGSLARQVRFAGVQYRSNFLTDPTFVTFPLPSIGGLAFQPSTVEVILDNTRRVTEEVPPGPFDIDNLPVVTGAGELQLRVTDLLGREQLVTQSYYVSPRLLREGLSEFSYEAGFAREDYNQESYSYGEPLAIGTHRYGFTNWATGAVHAELGGIRQAFGLGASLLAGPFGLVSGGGILTRDADTGEGYAAFADYEYRSNWASFGLRTRYESPTFRPLGALDEDPRVRRVDQASVGFGLGPVGRVGALVVNGEARDGDHRRVVSGNYSLPLWRGSFLVNAIQALEPDDQFAVTASYTIPLGIARTLTLGGAWRDGATRAGAQYYRGRGASDLGLSYRLAAEAGDDPRLFDGLVRYDASFASGQLQVARFEDTTNMQANVEGSFALVDGKARVSRRLGRAFGLVGLPGYPDVKVYLENREVGQTDAGGFLLLPQLNPYQANRIRIRAEDLPLTAEIASDELVAVPYARAGVAVDFEVATQRSALVVLRDKGGEPLPAGLELASSDGTMTAQVADDGLAYVRGTEEGPAELASVPGQPPFVCALPALPAEPMADLGVITCL